MKTKSCFSTNMDPYRAGVEIGRQLAEISPEVIFLFPTIHYHGSPELVEAIYDVLEDDRITLIGATGDGFFERDSVAAAGVSALGIHSEGRLTCHIVYEKGVGAHPEETTRKCVAKLNESAGSGTISLYFLFADFRTDASRILDALKDKKIGPVVGGLAGDDFSLKDAFVYMNREVLKDSIVMLGLSGDFTFDIRVAHHFDPVGQLGIITDCTNTSVRSINEMPAMDFIQRSLGKPLEVVDEGVIVFECREKQVDENRFVRSLLLPDDRDNMSEVRLFGSIEKGNLVQVCLAPPEKILEDSVRIVNEIQQLPFKPEAALLVSCAGRKKVLAGEADLETGAYARGIHSLVSLAGFPSFGEFGPERSSSGYSHPMFHNMTSILVLLGSSNE